jgi:hypothetical protein
MSDRKRDQGLSWTVVHAEEDEKKKASTCLPNNWRILTKVF